VGGRSRKLEVYVEVVMLVKVITKEGVKLPFMGKEKFIELMRLGMGYNRQRGMFFIEDLDRAEQVKAALSNILKDEVSFAQTCFFCRTDFPCTDCEFLSMCKSKDMPTYCFCKKCSDKPELYRKYVTESEKLAETVRREK